MTPQICASQRHHGSASAPHTSFNTGLNTLQMDAAVSPCLVFSFPLCLTFTGSWCVSQWLLFLDDVRSLWTCLHGLPHPLRMDICSFPVWGYYK